uniref:Uncharacterized protein n=1 Tax=Arundo donax TaxID=35708 RepID=A0A0A9HM87_ARUDO
MDHFLFFQQPSLLEVLNILTQVCQD